MKSAETVFVQKFVFKKVKIDSYVLWILREVQSHLLVLYGQVPDHGGLFHIAGAFNQVGHVTPVR